MGLLLKKKIFTVSLVSETRHDDDNGRRSGTPQGNSSALFGHISTNGKCSMQARGDNIIREENRTRRLLLLASLPATARNLHCNSQLPVNCCDSILHTYTNQQQHEKTMKTLFKQIRPTEGCRASLHSSLEF